MTADVFVGAETDDAFEVAVRLVVCISEGSSINSDGFTITVEIAKSSNGVESAVGKTTTAGRWGISLTTWLVSDGRAV